MALLVSAGVTVLFFMGWFLAENLVEASSAQMALFVVLPFGLPLLVGAGLTLGQRTRRVGFGVLGGLALGVDLAFILASILIAEMASNIGS